MKVMYGGKYIRLENDNDWDDLRSHPSLYCVCGHHLTEHEYHFLTGDKNTIEVTYCTRDGCKQFKRTGKETLNVAYA